MEKCLLEMMTVLNELSGDPAVSKNIKTRVISVISILKEDIDIGVRCDKAIQTLTFDEDYNIDMFTKTRIWSLLSMLESVS
jgi:uncharacterized protein (UPF0147 family)